MKRVKNGIPITQDHIDRLWTAKHETGCGAPSFLKWVKDAPKGLTSTTIHHWMNGAVSEANQEMLNFVLEHWPTMPRKIQVTEQLADKLNAEHTRTGLGPTRLLRTMSDVPDGLKAITVTHWKTMRADKAREDHVRAVLDAYAAVPGD